MSIEQIKSRLKKAFPNLTRRYVDGKMCNCGGDHNSGYFFFDGANRLTKTNPSTCYESWTWEAIADMQRQGIDTSNYKLMHILGQVCKKKSKSVNPGCKNDCKS